MIHRVLRALPALLIVAVCASAAQAAVYIPTKTDDTNDGACDPNDCSLREAIAAANQHAGEDVVLLRARTYFLTLPPAGNAHHLRIDDDVVILGEGAARTVIDGFVVNGIFHVSGNRNVEIRDLTLRNGRAQGAGGAIRNDGDLTLLRVALIANSSVPGAGGSGIGGALASEGDLTVVDSTIADNAALGVGGGVTLGGNATLTNVTLSGNRTEADFGGGLYIFSDARATLNNVTIAGNTAAEKGGGAFIESSAFVGVPPKVINSILAANIAAADPDCSGAINSAFNLIGNNQGCTGPSAANGDILGVPGNPRNPVLAPLDENGGPTRTRPLLPGSPAIDAGNPAAPGSGGDACAATDQRGADRPGGARCDMGAFEATTACVAGGSTLCLNNGRFRVTATFTAQGSTRAAQGVTLTDDSGYLFFFDPSNVELTIKVLNGCPVNSRYWVFVSGLTNVGVTVTVTDTRNGETRTYANAAGRVFRTRLDSSAFDTCP